MIIKSNKIKSETIVDAIGELEQRSDIMTHIRAFNLNAGDILESIATHIVYTDTDYIWLEGGHKDITTLTTKKQQRKEKRAEKKIKKALQEA